MPLANQIYMMIEELPEVKQNAILTILQSMVDPENHLTEEDIADIIQAREEFARGEYVRHEDIKWK